MSHLTLDPQAKAQVEAETGREVPDPNSPAFEALLLELKEARPDLSQRLLDGLGVPSLPLPAEEQARKAHRRAQRRAFFRQLFYSRQYEDEPTLNKRKSLAVIVCLLIAALPLVLVVDALSNRAPPSPEPVMMVAPSATPALDASPSHPGNTNALPFPTPGLPLPPEPLPGGMLLPPPPSAVDPAIASTPPSASGDLPTVPPGAPTLSVFRGAPRSPALRVHERSPEPAGITPVRVFAREQPPASSLSASTIGRMPQPAEALRLPPSAWRDTAGAASALSVMTADRQPGGTSPDPAPIERSRTITSLAPAGARPSLQVHETPSVPLAARQPPPSGATPTDPSTSAASGATTSPAVAPDNPRLVASLPAGSLVPARLLTGLALLEGAESPVVAETTVRWCGQSACPIITWIGRARLTGPGRVSIHFRQARTTGGTMPVEAVALSADGTPGLSATLRDMAPAAAQDLLRAAAGGVSRYVQNLADRQRVTIVGDRSVIEQTELPPLGAFVLGNIASLFDLPANQTAVVRVAQIPPGTRLQLLVGAADSP